MIQNLRIVRDHRAWDESGATKAITVITHEAVFQLTSASEVIQRVIDELAGAGGETLNSGITSLMMSSIWVFTSI